MVIAALPTESQRLPPLSPRILRTSKVTLHERERAAGDSLGRARVEHLLAQGAGEYLGSGVPYLHIFFEPVPERNHCETKVYTFFSLVTSKSRYLTFVEKGDFKQVPKSTKAPQNARLLHPLRT